MSRGTGPATHASSPLSSPLPPRLEEQVSNFKQYNPFARPSPVDPSRIYDIGLRLPSGEVLTVQLILPVGFPVEAPTVTVLQRVVTHPWLDMHQRVVGSPELQCWHPSKCLGPTGPSPSSHCTAVLECV